MKSINNNKEGKENMQNGKMACTQMKPLTLEDSVGQLSLKR